MPKSSASKKSVTLHWTAAGIAASAARFIPIPLLDGVVQTRAKRHAISQTLEARGRQYGEEMVSPLFGDGDRSHWLLRKLLRLPMKLLLYPIRKLVRVARSVTGVPRDFAHTFLLARTLDQCLAQGMLPNGAGEARLHESAERIRRVFDESFRELDDMALRSIRIHFMQEMRELKPAVLQVVYRILGREVDQDTVEREATRLREEMAEQATEKDSGFSVSRILADFDAKFDSRLTA